MSYTLFVILKLSAMKNISSTFEGKENGHAPQWIEPKVCRYSRIE